jgi:GTP cyclohydrolase I
MSDSELAMQSLTQATLNAIFTLKTRMKNYEKTELYNIEKLDTIANGYKAIIENLGEDTSREGIVKTPERAAKAMQFLTHGYQLNPLEILKSALFTEDHKQMIVVKEIEVYSMCEHHMLPFFGKAHVAYIPNGKIVGLSKIPRIIDAFARRMQVQERLTDEIKNCIQEALNPLGVAVMIEAQHMCMQMRGVQKQNSSTTTTSFSGVFENDNSRNEFYKMVNNR